MSSQRKQNQETSLQYKVGAGLGLRVSLPSRFKVQHLMGANNSLGPHFLVKSQRFNQFCVGKFLRVRCTRLRFTLQGVVLTTTTEWGAVMTKLNVPADWKEWQIYALLLGMFLASAVAFYIFFQNSDSFWKVPVRNQPARPNIDAVIGDPQSSDDQTVWGSFGALDL